MSKEEMIKRFEKMNEYLKSELVEDCYHYPQTNNIEFKSYLNTLTEDERCDFIDELFDIMEGKGGGENQNQQFTTTVI